MSIEIYIIGESVPCRASWTKKTTGVLYTPDQSATITIYIRADGTNTAKQTDQAMTEIATGISEYKLASSGFAAGEYFWIATGTDGTGADEYIAKCSGHFRLV